MALPKISEVIEVIENRIPKTCSESWDSVGLVCGDPSQAFKSLVIGVDLTETLLELALQKKANLIVIHHPPLFPKGKGLTQLRLKGPNELQTLLLQAFKKDICIYVAHTNFDRCGLDGMFSLAQDLGAVPHARVWESADEGKTLFKKLVTYVPEEHFETVRDALYMIGCGHIGNYDCCGFGSPGVGNFRPLAGASPFLGKVGELEQTEEIRLETLIVDGMQERALAVLKEAHPYEEVAYDFYPVEQEPSLKGMVWGFGYGFVADFKKPVPYDVFCKKVKSVFGVKNFVTHYATPKMVKRIAFTPGKGSSFLKSVRAHGVDVFLTGEVGYHGSIDSARVGLNVIELGHRESERYFLKTFQTWCVDWQLAHHVLDERTQQIL